MRALGLALCALGVFGCADAPAPRHVIVLVVDTLRADHLGFYGYARDTSPGLDAWAARGAVFDQALATSPWTLPSFASIYTGELPGRHEAARVPSKGHGTVVGKLAPDTATLAELLREQGFATAAIVNNPFLEAKSGIARGFDVYDYHPSRNHDKRRAADVVNRGLAWLEETGETPSFLLLHFFDPHMDYNPPKRTRGRFTEGYEGTLGYPVSDRRGIRRGRLAERAEDRAFIIGAYDEEVLYLDGEVTRLLQHLEESGRLEETLVLLVADHGEELFDHGGFEHGRTVYQEVLRVPFLAWGPGVGVRHIETPVSIADVMPTVLEAVGLPPRPGVLGRSLWPLLRGDASSRPVAVVAENTVQGPEKKAILRWPHKLLTDEKTGELRLFDLAADPGETRDLAAERPRLVATLQVELDAATGTGRLGDPAERIEFSEDVVERLRSLGYLDADAE